MAEIVGVVSASYAEDSYGRTRALMTVRVKRFFGTEEEHVLATSRRALWRDVTDGGSRISVNPYEAEAWFDKAIMLGIAKEVPA